LFKNITSAFIRYSIDCCGHTSTFHAVKKPDVETEFAAFVCELDILGTCNTTKEAMTERDASW